MALLLAAPTAAQQTIFLIRHAERADTVKGAPATMAPDPDLSEAGRARAASLATVLKDANITAIYTTKYKRTQQTAAPLAKARGVSPTIVKGDDNDALIKDLRAQKGNVLVVGHSNTVPGIIKSLGVSASIEIGDEEFDNLFVVVAGPTPTLVRLHYSR
jgi:broad specificity phosphatase PhoE